jgi:hemerythrin superfamily protein
MRSEGVTDMDITVQGKGKVKLAKAKLKGLTGIFSTLAEEHGEASALLNRIDRSSDPERWREVFPKVRKELLAHERGELAVLYPRLQQHEQTRQIVQDHQREADQLESLLEQLHAQPYESAEWKPMFSRLLELVEHHVEEEESTYFERAQEVLGKETAKQLNQEYKRRKQQEMDKLS